MHLASYSTVGLRRALTPTKKYPLISDFKASLRLYKIQFFNFELFGFKKKTIKIVHLSVQSHVGVFDLLSLNV